MTDSTPVNANVDDDDIISHELTVDPSASMSIDDFQRKVLLAMEQEQQQLNPGEYSLVQSARIPHKEKEDSKYDEIKSVLGSSIITNLNDSKWELKKQGFTAINEFILTQTPLVYNPSDLFSYIRYKLKDFKETNFNIVKEALIVFTTLASQKLLEKENCLTVINAYYEKIADIKLKEQLNAFILNALESVLRADTFIKNILAKLAKKNNVKVTIEYSVLFSRLVEEYEVDSLPVKEMVDMCKAMAANSNPQMRSSATSFLCVIYKWIGDDLRPLLKDIKESTLKIIEGELDKVEVVEHKENFLSKREHKGGNNNTNNNNNNTINNNNTLLMDDNRDEAMYNETLNNEMLPRVDISKKITPNILKDIRDGKWQEKKEACEAVEKILADACYKVLPVGLNEIFKLITTKLSDGNKNLVKMCIVLVGKFIRSLGDGFNKYIKQIALALLPNLSDKMPTVREECQNCLDIWVTYLGVDSIVMFIPAFMKTNNFDLRTESFKFITRHASKLNKSIGESFFKELVDPLLLCMQDKTGSIRSSAEETIAYSTKFIDINLYYNALKDFKPVIESDLRESLNRLQNEYECSNNNNNNNNAYLNTCTTPYVKKTQRNNKSTRSAERKNKSMERTRKRNKQTPKSNTTTHANTNTNTSNMRSKRNEKRPPQLISEDDYLNKTCMNNNRGTFAHTESTTSSFMKTPQKHLSSNSNALRPIKSQAIFKKPSNAILNKYSNLPHSSSNYKVFIPNINVKPPKERRIDNDKKCKFSIDTLLNEEHKLQEQLKNLFTEDIIKRAFSNEFKNVVAVINLLRVIIETQNEEMEIILDNLDLILKMICIKYNTNINPIMLKAFFEFLDALYQIIINIDYVLNDTEINIILPLLITKLTINNTALKEHLFELLHKYITIIGMGKATLVIDKTSLNRNVKIKSEIIDIITELYLNESVDIASKPYIKVLSRYLSVNDNVVKTKTISLFREIYSRIGDEIWQYIDITQKEKEFLERILFQDGDFMDDEEEFECDGDDSDLDDRSGVNKRTLKTNATVSHFNIININKCMKDDNKEKDKENYMSNHKHKNMNSNLNTNINTNSSNNNNKYHINNSNSNNITSAFSNNNSTYNSASRVKKAIPNQKAQYRQIQTNTNSTRTFGNSNNNSNGNSAFHNNNKEQSSHHLMEQQISRTKITGHNHNNNNTNNSKHNSTQNASLKTKSDLVNCLRNLLTDDSTEKVNSIIIIHELLCPKYEDNKTLLTTNIDIIINYFVKATHSLFSVKNIADIPIKYAKYLATVLCKIATNKELISNMTYPYLFELIEELLSDLLIDNLDKIGNNQEGNIIFKSLNSTMLRILENCNGTNVIIALLEIIRKYRVNNQNNKLASLAIKCILKVNQNLDNLIERLEYHRTLLQIHLLIIEIQKTSSDLTPKNQIDQVIVRYIKNLIHEMVKKKTNSIIDEYNKGVRNHSVPDKFIIEWIQNYLDIINSNQNRNCNGEGSKGVGKGKGVSNYQKSIVNSQGNNNGNSSTSQHVGTTISELKKKWNDASKKSENDKKK